jgi:hypothetical protein
MLLRAGKVALFLCTCIFEHFCTCPVVYVKPRILDALGTMAIDFRLLLAPALPLLHICVLSYVPVFIHVIMTSTCLCAVTAGAVFNVHAP